VVGIVQALTGDFQPVLQAIQAKANSWLQVIKSHFLPQPLLWMTLFHMLWPSLRYPLSITTLSPIQAHQTPSQLYQTLLPRLGVNHHFPVALCHASAQYLGLGLLNLYWEQGIGLIQLFLEHANGNTSEATLLYTSM